MKYEVYFIGVEFRVANPPQVGFHRGPRHCFAASSPPASPARLTPLGWRAGLSARAPRLKPCDAGRARDGGQAQCSSNEALLKAARPLLKFSADFQEF